MLKKTLFLSFLVSSSAYSGPKKDINHIEDLELQDFSGQFQKEDTAKDQNTENKEFPQQIHEKKDFMYLANKIHLLSHILSFLKLKERFQLSLSNKAILNLIRNFVPKYYVSKEKQKESRSLLIHNKPGSFRALCDAITHIPPSIESLIENSLHTILLYKGPIYIDLTQDQTPLNQEKISILKKTGLPLAGNIDMIYYDELWPQIVSLLIKTTKTKTLTAQHKLSLNEFVKQEKRPINIMVQHYFRSFENFSMFPFYTPPNNEQLSENYFFDTVRFIQKLNIGPIKHIYFDSSSLSSHLYIPQLLEMLNTGAFKDVVNFQFYQEKGSLFIYEPTEPQLKPERDLIKKILTSMPLLESFSSNMPNFFTDMGKEDIDLFKKSIHLKKIDLKSEFFMINPSASEILLQLPPNICLEGNIEWKMSHEFLKFLNYFSDLGGVNLNCVLSDRDIKSYDDQQLFKNIIQSLKKHDENKLEEIFFTLSNPEYLEILPRKTFNLKLEIQNLEILDALSKQGPNLKNLIRLTLDFIEDMPATEHEEIYKNKLLSLFGNTTELCLIVMKNAPLWIFDFIVENIPHNVGKNVGRVNIHHSSKKKEECSHIDKTIDALHAKKNFTFHCGFEEK